MFLSKLLLRSQPRLLASRSVLGSIPQRFYYEDNVVMKRVEGEYFADPMDVAERTIRLVGLHDKCINPSDLTTALSFEEIGLNDLDMVEVFLMLEREFDMEFDEDDCEKMTTINDIVEHLSRNFYTK